MDKNYHVPLTQFSLVEREEYKKGINLLAGGNISGLEVVLRVLQNSRPIFVPGEPERTLPWAIELIDAYRNVGRAIQNVSLGSVSDLEELKEKLKKYNDIILEENDEAPYQPLFDTLDRFREFYKILKEHEIEEPEQLEEVLERKEKDKNSELTQVEKFGNSF